jgi:hypothetical protein
MMRQLAALPTGLRNTVLTIVNASLEQVMRRADGQAALQEQGLSDEMRRKLHLLIATETMASRECCVCMEAIRLGEEVTALEHCKHVFHSHCVREWWTRSQRCPLCRRNAISGLQ